MKLFKRTYQKHKKAIKLAYQHLQQYSSQEIEIHTFSKNKVYRLGSSQHVLRISKKIKLQSKERQLFLLCPVYHHFQCILGALFTGHNVYLYLPIGIIPYLSKIRLSVNTSCNINAITSCYLELGYLS